MKKVVLGAAIAALSTSCFAFDMSAAYNSLANGANNTSQNVGSDGVIAKPLKADIFDIKLGDQFNGALEKMKKMGLKCEISKDLTIQSAYCREEPSDQWDLSTPNGTEVQFKSTVKEGIFKVSRTSALDKDIVDSSVQQIKDKYGKADGEYDAINERFQTKMSEKHLGWGTLYYRNDRFYEADKGQSLIITVKQGIDRRYEYNRFTKFVARGTIIDAQMVDYDRMSRVSVLQKEAYYKTHPYEYEEFKKAEAEKKKAEELKKSKLAL